ncbi:TetR/AcrR family transcriptional regulator [Hwanghaeella sp.]|uniref:TetR/AcrR family transcriptional regulator n=1 Tax=Hwanghaeella sp. TaxID=2605943 RepID=UPI003CCBF803
MTQQNATAEPQGKRLSPEQRRREIILGTINALAAHGPQKCSLRQVARDMGIAPSLLTYFFNSWADLLLETYRWLAEMTDKDFVALAEKRGGKPKQDLQDYLDLYFSDKWTRDEVAGAYISFWALARGEVDLKTEMLAFSEKDRARARPYLEAYLKSRGIEENIDALNEVFCVMLSGIWYEIAVNPIAMNRELGMKSAWTFLDAVAPSGT